ncbi:hypothetical protein BV25DRAFT_1911760 [Artomyces pyxidatus]|uniref:Uncharacterized protein n=1 Tax=Artomyces pyxidatus TaxID=48021 RepID=A0ACB8THM9_9AGAM|nr:hypothetical protein BV25DRAFT_1911760 [Artomyces pyxidatus]
MLPFYFFIAAALGVLGTTIRVQTVQASALIFTIRGYQMHSILVSRMSTPLGQRGTCFGLLLFDDVAKYLNIANTPSSLEPLQPVATCGPQELLPLLNTTMDCTTNPLPSVNDTVASDDEAMSEAASPSPIVAETVPDTSDDVEVVISEVSKTHPYSNALSRALQLTLDHGFRASKAVKSANDHVPWVSPKVFNFLKPLILGIAILFAVPFSVMFVSRADFEIQIPGRWRFGTQGMNPLNSPALVAEAEAVNKSIAAAATKSPQWGDNVFRQAPSADAPTTSDCLFTFRATLASVDDLEGSPHSSVTITPESIQLTGRTAPASTQTVSGSLRPTPKASPIAKALAIAGMTVPLHLLGQPSEEVSATTAVGSPLSSPMPASTGSSTSETQSLEEPARGDEGRVSPPTPTSSTPTPSAHGSRSKRNKKRKNGRKN